MDHAELIDRYEQGPAAVRAALVGITETELDRRPSPEAWTPREIVHRTGWHTESGLYTLRDWLVTYAAQAHDHAAQIERARQGRV